MRLCGIVVLLSLAVTPLGLRESGHVYRHTTVVPHRTIRAQMPPLRIGSFDVTRNQQGSFTEGGFFDQARAAVLANFPDATFHSTSELTPQFLAEIDLLVLTVMSAERLPVMPLSESERTALRTFVAQGGCLTALVDNSSHSSGQTRHARLDRRFLLCSSR